MLLFGEKQSKVVKTCHVPKTCMLLDNEQTITANNFEFKKAFIRNLIVIYLIISRTENEMVYSYCRTVGPQLWNTHS